MSDLNISQIMNTWTKQKSFPVVTIKKINSTSYSITQESFLDAKQSIKTNNIRQREKIGNNSSIMADYRQNITGVKIPTITNTTHSIEAASLKNKTESRPLTNATWIIPLTYITKNNNNETLVWMHEKSMWFSGFHVKEKSIFPGLAYLFFKTCRNFSR